MKRFSINVLLVLIFTPALIVQGQQLNAADRLFQAGESAEKKGDRADDSEDNGPKARAFYQAALTNYGQALDLYRAARDTDGQLDCLLGEGYVYSQTGDYGTALVVYRQALPLEPGNTETLEGMAKASFQLGNFSDAMAWYEKALPLVSDRADRGDLLHELGDTYSKLGRNSEALEAYQKALPLQTNADDREDVIYSIGETYYALAKNSAALASYNQALAIAQRLGDSEELEKIYNSIGLVYSIIGQNENALKNYAAALQICRDLHDSYGEGIEIDNIGDVYLNRGELRKALEQYEQSRTISIQTKNRNREALVLAGIGLAYSRLGDQHRAVDYYTQALAIAVEIRNLKTQGTLLNNIGLLYRGAGDTQKALQYYMQALQLRRETGFRDGEGVTLNNIGQAFYQSHDLPKALEYYEAALKIKREVGDRKAEAVTLSNIALVYAGQGQRDKALGYLAQALPIERAVGDRFTEATTLSSLSRQYPSARPEAAFFAKQAVNTMQSLRADNDGLTAATKAKFEESIKGYYRRLAGLLAGQGRFGEAEEVLDLLKHEEAADFIRRDGISDKLKKVPLTPQEQSAVTEYEANMAKSVAITTAPGNTEAVSNANLVLQTYLRKVADSFPATSSLSAHADDVRKSSEKIQRALQQLGPTTAAIYTLVQPDSYTAIVTTTRGHQGYVSSIAEQDLNQLAFSLRKALQDPGSDPAAAAQKLYSVMFPETMRADLDAIGIKTILWALDGTLRYIPMSALFDGRQYLVSIYGNAVITPDGDNTTKSEVSMKGVGFGVSKPHEGFRELPGAKRELGRIFTDPSAPLSPAVTASDSVLMDEQFSQKTFVNSMNGKNASVVHIATHFVSQGDATQSGLLLGDGTLFTLSDIESQNQLFDGVDLLTLSACSTAFEQLRADGHEVDSLGTVAEDLGAKTVIASLWNVSDEATASLMEAMYRSRKDQSLGKLEALRQAQLKLATGQLRETSASASRSLVPALPSGPQGWQHPYYWAAFILIGNTR